MLHRRVADLMTTAVVRVRPDTSFKDIAVRLAEHEITAVPVVDDQDHPIGIVSEADLLRTQQSQSDPSGHLPDEQLPPAESAKAHALMAEGLMTSPVITARPQWSVVEAARTMARHHVKRLPVVDDADRMVGIISRSDLVQVFLRRDATIYEEITTEVLTRTLGLDPASVTVQVADGRVTLTGAVQRSSLIPVAVRLCESVDGVINVTSHLRSDVNDTAGTPQSSPAPAVGPNGKETTMTTARDIMHTGATCIREGQTLEDAARKMKELDVGALPICGEDDRLHGIITDRDIVVKCLAKGKDPRTVTAGQLEQGKPITVDADAETDRVLQVMQEHKIRRLPVIENHRLVGMISEADLARRLPEEQVGHFVEAICATR